MEPCTDYHPDDYLKVKNIHAGIGLIFSRQGQVPIGELATHTESNPAIAGFAGVAATGHTIVISEAIAATNQVTIMDSNDGCIDTWPYAWLQSSSPYGTWILTDLITGYVPGVLQAFQSDYCSSWGDIKTIYDPCSEYWSGSSSMSAFEDGALEPRSSDYNRIAWRDFAGATGQYNILRSIDDTGAWATLKIQGAGDTVLIDSTITSGHVYHYGVLSHDGDTLKYTDEMTCGLQKTSELNFYDINGSWSSIVNDDTTYAAKGALLIPEGQYLLLASDLKVKKIDVSDPYNPIEVGSRDLSFLPEYNGAPQGLRDMQVGYYGSYLFVLTNGCLVIIDKTINAMPIVSMYYLSLPVVHDLYSLAIKDPVAYIAVAGESGAGIYAISFRYPANPEAWGYYPGFGQSIGLSPKAIESVGGYLYVEFGAGNHARTEILQPRVYESSESVCFDLIGSDHDSLVSLPAAADLIARTSAADAATRGNPAGCYALGKSDDSTLAVYDISDPVNPEILQEVAPPWSQYDRVGDIAFTVFSYAFDDQFLYIGMNRWTDNPWSSVYAFDLYSGSSNPVYAIGDMIIGQDKTASIASWGKHLYYFDRASDDRAYHRLQILEKARGCDPNMSIAFGPDPIYPAYQISSNVQISWTCTGCPTRVDILLIEDGNASQPIASLKKTEIPDLSAGSIQWQAQGISPDPENHLYEIKLLAWNIEGKSAWRTAPVRIVEHFEVGEKDPIPIAAVSLEGGGTEFFPLSGLADQSSARECPSYLILPDRPTINNGSLSIIVAGCENVQLILTDMALITVDSPENYTLLIDPSGPTVVPPESGPIPIVPIAESAPPPAQGDSQVLGVRESRAMPAGRRIEISEGEQLRLEFTTTDKPAYSTRHYLLRYCGVLLDSENAGNKIPSVFALKDPYPNPFNPTTTIEYHVPGSAKIELAIYDAAGRLIKTLKDSEVRPGIYAAIWDGHDSAGNAVSSGVYFCRLSTDDDQTFVKKLVLLR